MLLPDRVPMFQIPFYTGTSDNVFIVPGFGEVDTAEILLAAAGLTIGERVERLRGHWKFIAASVGSLEQLANTPPHLLRSEIPVAVIGSSRDLPPIKFDSFADLLQVVADMSLSRGLNALAYHFGRDWRGLLKASGIHVEGYIPEPSTMLDHDMAHLLATAALSVWIGVREGLEVISSRVKALWWAGLLHDVGRSSDYGANDAITHAAESARIARALLAASGVDGQVVDEVVRAIEDHVTDASRSPISVTLREADSLERFRLGVGECSPAYLRSITALGLVSIMERHYNPPWVDTYGLEVLRGGPPVDVARAASGITRVGRVSTVGMPGVTVGTERIEARPVSPMAVRAAESVGRAGEAVEFRIEGK